MKCYKTHLSGFPLNLRNLLSPVAITCVFAGSAIAQEAPDNEVDQEDVVVLSPFEVSTNEGEDYYVSDTLAGSRLRSDSKDIGAAITHVTKNFLDDLGASDIMEVADFIPSLEALDNQESGQDQSVATYRPQSFRIRGLFSESFARNYHGVASGPIIPQDGYNTDRLTLSAGANSILFGSANPAGIVNTSTVKAQTHKEFSEVRFRTDDRGSTRYELHHNQPLLDGKAALRIAYLNEDAELYPEPSWRKQDRLYIAGRWDITENTKITGNFETLDYHRNAPYVSNMRSFYGAWEDAGSNVVPYTGSNPTNGGLGIRNYTGSPFQTPVWGSLGGEMDVVPSWRHHAISNFNRVTVDNLNREPTPPEFNNGRDLAENLRVQDQRGNVAEINLEHKFTDNLYMQLSAFYHEIYQDMWISWSSNQVGVDAASTLPDGSSNPDAGRYYLNGGVMQIRELDFENLNFRWTASYDLDLEKVSKWLGRHQFAAMIEDNSGTRWTNRGQLFNTDAARPNQNYLSGQNKLRTIIYVDPQKGLIGDGPKPDTRTMDTYLSTFPGITAEWKNFIEGTHETIEQRAYMIAAQSHFFNDRFVTTAGYRIDEQDFWNTPAGTWDRDPNTNFYLNYQDNTAPKALVDDVSNLSEGTYSLGAVLHLIEDQGALDYFSLTYNRSNNFAPSPGFPDFYGSVTPNSTGETEDIGLKAGMFGNKLHATVNFFESGQLNARGPNVGAMTNAYNSVWFELEESTGDQSYLNNLLDTQSSNSDTFDNAAEGLEFQLTYTPVSNWRLSFMASQNETIKTNILPRTAAFMATEFPKVKSAHGSYIMEDGQTVTEHLNEAEALMQPQFTQEGTRPLNQREWRYNLITNYRFSQGPLEGFSIGGYFKWQDKPVIGYFRDGNNQPNPFDIIYGDTFLDTGLNFGYRTRIMNDKVEWSTTINIRNLLNDEDIIPREAGQTSATDRTPFVYTYNFRAPRSLILSTSFKF